MNKEEEPKVLYKITAYDSDFVKELPDKVRTVGGTINYYYDFKKHRYLSQFVSDDFDIYDELKNKQDKINKAIEVLKLCNSQYAKETIEILKGDSNE